MLLARADKQACTQVILTHRRQLGISTDVQLIFVCGCRAQMFVERVDPSTPKQSWLELTPDDKVQLLATYADVAGGFHRRKDSSADRLERVLWSVVGGETETEAQSRLEEQELIEHLVDEMLAWECGDLCGWGGQFQNKYAGWPGRQILLKPVSSACASVDEAAQKAKDALDWWIPALGRSIGNNSLGANCRQFTWLQVQRKILNLVNPGWQDALDTEPPPEPEATHVDFTPLHWTSKQLGLLSMRGGAPQRGSGADHRIIKECRTKGHQWVGIPTDGRPTNEWCFPYSTRPDLPEWESTEWQPSAPPPLWQDRTDLCPRWVAAALGDMSLGSHSAATAPEGPGTGCVPVWDVNIRVASAGLPVNAPRIVYYFDDQKISHMVMNEQATSKEFLRGLSLPPMLHSIVNGGEAVVAKWYGPLDLPAVYMDGLDIGVPKEGARYGGSIQYVVNLHKKLEKAMDARKKNLDALLSFHLLRYADDNDICGSLVEHCSTNPAQALKSFALWLQAECQSNHVLWAQLEYMWDESQVVGLFDGMHNGEHVEIVRSLLELGEVLWSCSKAVPFEHSGSNKVLDESVEHAEAATPSYTESDHVAAGNTKANYRERLAAQLHLVCTLLHIVCGCTLLHVVCTLLHIVCD